MDLQFNSVARQCQYHKSAVTGPYPGPLQRLHLMCIGFSYQAMDRNHVAAMKGGVGLLAIGDDDLLAPHWSDDVAFKCERS